MDRAVRKTRRAWRFGSLARCVVTAVGLPESESILNLARSHVEQHGNDGLFWLGMLSASTAATWRNDLLRLLVSELRAQPHEVALWQGLAVSGLLPDEPRTLLAELNVQLGRQWNGS